MSSQRRGTFLPRRDDAFHEHFELVRRRNLPVPTEKSRDTTNDYFVTVVTSLGCSSCYSRQHD